MNTRGFTLIETVIIILVIGILSSIAVSKLGPSIETAKVEHTKAELEQIAKALVGDPSTYSSGTQGSFGYVGDIGALPPTLDALMSKPGGYSTWSGPYLEANFGTVDYKKDGWGSDYQLVGLSVRSTGSGSNIDRAFASAAADLLQNAVNGVIQDAGGQKPGMIWDDSTSIRLAYPDGTGGIATTATNPSPNGTFSFSNIPIGVHTLTVIYIPATDTMTWQVTVYPRQISRVELTFPADIY